MEKFEKVIYILEREAIHYEEKEYLKRIATEDIDIKNFHQCTPKAETHFQFYLPFGYGNSCRVYSLL